MQKIWKYAATISFGITFAGLVYISMTDPVMHLLLLGDPLMIFTGIMFVVSVYSEIGLDFLKRIGYDENMNRTKTNTIQINNQNQQEDIQCLQKTTPPTNQPNDLIGQPLKPISNTVSEPLS